MSDTTTQETTQETTQAHEEYTDDSLSDAFRAWLKSVKYHETADPIYGQEGHGTTYPINFIELAMNRDLFRELLTKPARALDALSRAVASLLKARFAEVGPQTEVNARLVNYPEIKPIADIKGNVIGRLTCVSGLVVQATEVYQRGSAITYRCLDNHKTIVAGKFNGKSKPPVVCSNPDCNHRNLELDEDCTDWQDFQLLRIQDVSDKSITPKMLAVYVTRDLVDAAPPGTYVKVTGVVRADNHKHGHIAVIQANNIEQIKQDGERPPLTDELKQKFGKMGQQEDLYRKVVGSIAPFIYGREAEKEAIALALAGAPEFSIPGTKGKTRGQIHIMIIGDPGTGKSRLLMFAHEVAPKSVYTNGAGSTGVGLTAAVVQVDGVWTVMAGPAVMADQGTMICDEFDKVPKGDTDAVHDFMEHQRILIDKAGLRRELKARANVIAAANPVDGHYNTDLTIMSNVDVKTSLLSRFELIMIVTDPVDPETNNRIVEAIAANYTGAHRKAPPFSVEELSLYIEYVRTLTPTLPPKLVPRIKSYYRAIHTGQGPKYITPRMIEGVIRLSLAKARYSQHPEVTQEDLETVIPLLNNSFNRACYDPDLGHANTALMAKSQSPSPKPTLDKSTAYTITHTDNPTIERVAERLVATGKTAWPNIATATSYLVKRIDEGLLSTNQDGQLSITGGDHHSH